MKIRYISVGEKSALYEDFKKIYGDIIEVEKTTHKYEGIFYTISDTSFNRELFFRLGADPLFLIDKRIRGERCIVIHENNKSALTLLRRDES